jgi:hypothetical protein
MPLDLKHRGIKLNLLFVVGWWLLVACWWLLVIGYWLLVISCLLSIVNQRIPTHQPRTKESLPNNK